VIIPEVDSRWSSKWEKLIWTVTEVEERIGSIKIHLMSDEGETRVEPYIHFRYWKSETVEESRG